MAVLDGAFRPNRATACQESLQQFIADFFAQNPLSQLSLIAMRDGKAEKLTDLSANKRAHVDAVARGTRACSGDASLQNAVDVACGLLRDIPEYGHREVVVVFGSLSTKDPGDIFASFAKAQRLRVQASVVGMAAELYVLQELAARTGGTAGVATGVDHLRRLLAAFLVPPPTMRENTPAAEMVEMGFPKRETTLLASSCLGYDGSSLMPLATAYTCPRCETRASEVPSVCAVCTMPLVSSPHLAQSYHHLFPLAPFDQLPAATVPAPCAGCGLAHRAEGRDATERFACPDCHHVFCVECEAFLHDTLHNCPGCDGF
jgi:transcription initiation factor TFIIH subunit 2